MMCLASVDRRILLSCLEFARKARDPLGLTVGKTLLLGSGDGLDLSLGAYDLEQSPDGGHSWQLSQ